MTIERVIQLRQRPGLYLAGKISSGTVRTGDRRNLLDGGSSTIEGGTWWIRCARTRPGRRRGNGASLFAGRLA